MEVKLIGKTVSRFTEALDRGSPEWEWWLAEKNYSTSGVESIAEFAGRNCYQSWHRPNPLTANNRSYLANVISHEHFSVLEHNAFTFYITGVSRTLTHEFLRHRHLSFSELSQRYVDISDYSVIEPPLVKQYNDYPDCPWEDDNNPPSVGIYDMVFNYLVSKGHSTKEARGAARAYVEAGLETKIVVTGNARTWREVIQKRNSAAADIEIRLLAQEILRQLKREAPNLFQDIELAEN